MLLDVFLPLSLAFIMLSLGLGLTFADFGRVLTMPLPVIVGLLAQIVLLPVTAFVLLMIFPLPPALAVGVMLLSFCPGGVTSNILTRIAGGTVALSITLTAVVSLLSVLTVPVLTGWAVERWLPAEAPEIDVTGIALAMFAITAVPVLIGLFLRAGLPGLVARIEKGVSALALVLFVVIVVGALAANWQVFRDNIGTLGPLLVVMNVVLLLLGVLAARLMGLTGGDGVAISVEMGVQNATLGITVAALISATPGLSEYAVPSGVYGITMYFVTLPGIFLLRRFFG